MATLAFTTYDELKASIVGYLKRSDLTSEIPGFIHLTEKIVEKALRYTPGETTSSYATTGAISAYQNLAGPGYTTCTSAGHTLIATDKIAISGSINYNGTCTVSSPAGNFFNIDKTYVANDAAGSYRKLLKMAVGQDYIDLPTGCLEPIHLRLERDPLVYCEVVSLHTMTRILQSDTSGVPRVICPFGTKILLAPIPTTVIWYTLFYKARVAYLKDGAGGGTTWLLTEAPDILLYGSLANAEPYIKNDERLPQWSQMFQNALALFARQQWRRRTGGGDLRCQPDFDVP